MKYGLIGEKLSHSYSEIIHNSFGNHEYKLTEVSKNDFDEFMSNRDFCGINVTIPYKKDVIPYLDYISDEAKKIGSVNTVINKNGRLYGYNTDYFGFLSMSKSNGISFNDKKILILGSGGTSLTAKAVCENEGAREIVVVSRNGEDNYDNIYKHYDSDIVINTTPVGMYPNTDISPVNLYCFKNLCGVIDVIYNPEKTLFVQMAKDMGVANTSGLPMLVYQALKAHNLFFDSNLSCDVAQNVLNNLKWQTRNIVLVGMPGSGKSTVGKIISDLTQREFIDTDDLIVNEYGKDIPAVFKEFGEQHFRQTEKECIAKCCKQKGKIIATGGGAVLNNDNIFAMRQNGVVVFIKRDIQKLSTKGRPLSKSRQDLEVMYNRRILLYKKACDIEIDINENPEICAQNILKLIKEV